MLWNGGISFGGVIAFIYADLIVLPILDIYRKYCGLKMAGFLFVTFYVAMAGAALIVEAIFWMVGLIPTERNARIVAPSIEWNYTTLWHVARDREGRCRAPLMGKFAGQRLGRTSLTRRNVDS